MSQVTGLATDLGGAVTFRRYTIDHTDVAALGASTTGSITLFTLPIGGIILGVRIHHTEAFAGGTIASMTVSVDGATAGAAAYATAFNIFQAVAATTFQTTTEFKCGTATATEVISAGFTSGVGNLSAATAGSVDIDVCFLNVSTPL